MARFIIMFLFFCSAVKSNGQAPPLDQFNTRQQIQIKNYVNYVVKYSVDSAGAQIKKDYTYQDYLRSVEINKLKDINAQQSDSIKSLYDSLATYNYSNVDVDPIINRITALEIKTEVMSKDIEVLKQYMIFQQQKYIELGAWRPTN